MSEIYCFFLVKMSIVCFHLPKIRVEINHLMMRLDLFHFRGHWQTSVLFSPRNLLFRWPWIKLYSLLLVQMGYVLHPFIPQYFTLDLEINIPWTASNRFMLTQAFTAKLFLWNYTHLTDYWGAIKHRQMVLILLHKNFFCFESIPFLLLYVLKP